MKFSERELCISGLHLHAFWYLLARGSGKKELVWGWTTRNSPGPLICSVWQPRFSLPLLSLLSFRDPSHPRSTVLRIFGAGRYLPVYLPTYLPTHLSKAQPDPRKPNGIVCPKNQMQRTKQLRHDEANDQYYSLIVSLEKPRKKCQRKWWQIATRENIVDLIDFRWIHLFH